MTTPASYPGGANGAFTSGVLHPVNERPHVNSFTTGSDARYSASLMADSEKFNALVPHKVGQAAPGQDDTTFEQYQREQGSYEPGSMPSFADHIEQGSDES